MSKIPYVRQQDGPYAQQLGLQQVVIQATPPPPTYLVWSILNCLFCCWPLGIAAIIFSNKVTENAANNDQVGALEASQTARNINIAATVIGSIAIIIIIVIMVMHMSDFSNQLNDLVENASLGYN